MITVLNDNNDNDQILVISNRYTQVHTPSFIGDKDTAETIVGTKDLNLVIQLIPESLDISYLVETQN